MCIRDRNFDMAGMQMIYGNPDLKPEKSDNYNLALEHAGRVKNAEMCIRDRR